MPSMKPYLKRPLPPVVRRKRASQVSAALAANPKTPAKLVAERDRFHRQVLSVRGKVGDYVVLFKSGLRRFPNRNVAEKAMLAAIRRGDKPTLFLTVKLPDAVQGKVRVKGREVIWTYPSLLNAEGVKKMNANPSLAAQARPIVQEVLRMHGLSNKFTIKKTSFSGFGYGDGYFVTIEGWKPDRELGMRVKTFILEKLSVLRLPSVDEDHWVVEFKGPGIVGNPRRPRVYRMSDYILREIETGLYLGIGDQPTRDSEKAAVFSGRRLADSAWGWEQWYEALELKDNPRRNIGAKNAGFGMRYMPNRCIDPVEGAYRASDRRGVGGGGSGGKAMKKCPGCGDLVAGGGLCFRCQHPEIKHPAKNPRLSGAPEVQSITVKQGSQPQKSLVESGWVVSRVVGDKAIMLPRRNPKASYVGVLTGGDKAIIRQMVGRLHVGSSNEEVVTYVLGRLTEPISARTAKAIGDYAIEVHSKNSGLYSRVMGGKFNPGSYTLEWWQGPAGTTVSRRISNDKELLARLTELREMGLQYTLYDAKGKELESRRAKPSRNPGRSYHKREEARYKKLLRGDLKAGHRDASSYWQGALSAEAASVAAGGVVRNPRMSKRQIKARLEYLRSQIEAESISYGEISELQDLAKYIEPGDVLLLEWAGVPESGAKRNPRSKRRTSFPGFSHHGTYETPKEAHYEMARLGRAGFVTRIKQDKKWGVWEVWVKDSVGRNPLAVRYSDAKGEHSIAFRDRRAFERWQEKALKSGVTYFKLQRGFVGKDVKRNSGYAEHRRDARVYRREARNWNAKTHPATKAYFKGMAAAHRVGAYRSKQLGIPNPLLMVVPNPSDSERGQWIDNDEGLYNWWRSSRQSKTAFIKEHRAEIDEVIANVTGHKKPAHYLAYPGPRMNPRALGVPERHQLRIALDTLKMTPAMAGVMGGMTVAEAKAFLKRSGLTDEAIAKLAQNPKGKGKKAAKGKKKWGEVVKSLTIPALASLALKGAVSAGAGIGLKAAAAAAGVSANPSTDMGTLMKNPRFRQAVALYRKFHGCEPKSVKRVLVPIGDKKRIDGREFFVSLGKAPSEAYDPPSHSGKAGSIFVHPYERKPEKVVSADGKTIVTLPGSHRVTDWIRG